MSVLDWLRAAAGLPRRQRVCPGPQRTVAGARGRRYWLPPGLRQCLATAPAPQGLQLNAQQQEAVDGITGEALIRYLFPAAAPAEGPLLMALVGPAGTGKTTTTRALAAQFVGPGRRVGFAAPTHKAAGVMAQALGVERARVITVASLLGLREQISDDRSDFVPAAPHRLGEADVWIVDEASMIHPEHLALVRRHGHPSQVVVFVGDAAQLPPVGHDESPALQLEPRYHLTTVHRHAGAVLDLATAIRGGPHHRPWLLQTAGDHDAAVIVHPTVEAWQSAFLAVTIAAGPESPDSARVLAYRNVTVDAANAAIRRTLLGPNAPPFVAGERLICNGGAFDHRDADDSNAPPAFGSCQEVIVEGVVFGARHIALNNGGITYAHLLSVRTDEGKWAELLVACDPPAIAAELEVMRAEKRWRAFWRLKRAFPRLNRHWAMTVHKAQGSQFDQVFIDAADLDRARGDQRRCLWYTAVTRARRAVHVVADRWAPPPVPP